MRDEHGPSRAREAEAVFDVFDDRLRVGIDEHDVVGVLVHPGQDVERATGDEPNPVRLDARLGEERPGVLLVVEFGVDRRQRGVRAACQQPEPRYADARSDLDDARCVGGRDDHSGLSSDRWGDRVDPELEGLLTRTRDDVMLDDDLVGELPVRFFV